jgi:N-acetylmuramoyl-L-alanine amidase
MSATLHGVLAELAVVAAFSGPSDLPPRIVGGRSVGGTRIVAVRNGPANAPARLLVTGSIHGTEPAGLAVIRRLRRMKPPDGVAVWTVRTVNPDGLRRGTRQNLHGVDLNRNFPSRWRGGGRPFDGYYPGPGAASEPETRALMRIVRRIRPAISIHYHQDFGLVNLTGGPDPNIVRAYARDVGLPAKRLPRLHGTDTGWQNTTFPRTSAFVVELRAGALTPKLALRHARAVMARGSALVNPGDSSAAAPKPPIVWSPIPFGADRIRQMRAYAVRHYGLHRARLIDPKVIVEHFTATSSYGPAYNTFAANQPDVELHERPGVCSHFIVDRDGTIHQLVALKWMCRHTIGLNHTAVGIEHVGTSDADVMGRAREREASLRLTRRLMERFGIRRRDVIGHAESLASPYHRERVSALRSRTHGDFASPVMRRYRRML